MCCLTSEPSLTDQIAYSAISVVSLFILAPIVLWLVPKFVLFAVREFRLHRAVSKAVANFGDDRLLELLNTISALGSTEPMGCMLHEVSRESETGSYTIRLPSGIPDFPWSGQMVRAEFQNLQTENPVTFSLSENGSVDDLLTPHIFWPPRIARTGKKATHIYSPTRLLKLSPAVRQVAENAFPKEPVRFLEGVFRKFGLLEYSVRIGLQPEWVQNFRRHRCSKCSQPVRLIIQVPGYEIHGKLGEFVFYFFGCSRHPDITVSDWDCF
jgi:hypothetical protein